ncbi:hypothetical protein B0H67DRAFT_479855 [Lasiosphaeris hirsuta]|uniref:Uncharacterized protein n=1 Tax=Lasiosphaeris hirsuta TaxID=260670 RepID=A0AA40AYW2_9PEZI|nr:hypothetical protein B0H67DRAFT_479855 [Lasiosphaeris hirsuta]
MPTSPTPREVRRLASDHDFVLGASPSPRRLGWWAFLATHLSLIAAFGAGAICVIVAIIYTSTTSRQMLDCPSWATNCEKADGWTIEHLGTIQGIITLIYFIGLAALAHVALALCEAAVWPLLTKQPFTIRGLDAYLATARGSITSAPAALMSIRTLATGLVLIAAIAVTLIPLASAPLVGFAFTPTRQLVELEADYVPGGGITEQYAQTDPPTSVIAGVLAEYHSWATDPSSEPLPEYRDWYIDRVALSQRGSFSARAVKLQTVISCVPHQVQQLSRNGSWWNAFLTNMTQTNSNSSQVGDKNSSAEVWVRTSPELTLWANNFEFVSPHRTRTTLIFAALNGTIDGGAPARFVHPDMYGASAVACDVDIEALDDLLTVGDSPIPSDDTTTPVLSSLSNLQVSPIAEGQTDINELLLWFTVSPLMAGSSVDGTQPMFFNSTSSNRAVPYTTSTAERNTWTVAGLEEFIRLSIGALAQTTTTTTTKTATTPDTNTNITLTFTTSTKKLSPPRALLLTILPSLILAVALATAGWLTYVHAHDNIPVMRTAGVGELLKSAQSGYLREVAATDAARAYLPHELGAVEVMYGVDKNGMAGLARSVRGFRGTAVQGGNAGAGRSARRDGVRAV